MIRAVISALLFSTPALAQAEPEPWARLPEPVTNNAVAGVELDGRMMAYSFAGLHEGKTWRDVTADAYACDLTARECREIDGLPDGIGRLAAVAVTVREQIYIFGGYTVAEDHSERSTPEVWRFDPASETYTHITDMPVPVDDTVALPFQDRYIYLVSGWHDTDNVDLVQVYDVEEDRWFEATPFPGAPVFGHAGAIESQNGLIVCGGTAVIPPPSPNERRSFEAIDDCWAGSIGNSLDEIVWQEAAPVHGGPLYRAAGVSLPGDSVMFVGGTENSYNYNGIGYNGEASEPVERGWFRSQTCLATDHDWLPGVAPVPPVMDLRSIVVFERSLFIVGGMLANQRVSNGVWRHSTHQERAAESMICGHP